MTTAVRRAVEADFEAWFRLFEDVAAEGRWLGSEAPLDRANRRVVFDRGLAGEEAATFLVEDVLAEDFPAGENGRLAGAISLHAGGGVVDLVMFVAAGRRGAGVGAALLGAGVSWAREQGAHKVSLGVWTHNHTARALYARSGFVEEGTRRRHYRRRNGELWDVTVMGLVLDETTPGGPRPVPPARPLLLPAEGLSIDDVVLRPWRGADVGALPDAVADPDIRRWLDRIPDPYTTADAEEFVAGNLAAGAAGTGLSLAVTVGGELVGSIGLTLADADRATGEVGYWVAARARGRGVATVATEAMVGWAFTHGGVRRLELHAAVDNLASRRVAERAGFELDGVRRSWRCVHGEPTDFAGYARIRPAP